MDWLTGWITPTLIDLALVLLATGGTWLITQAAGWIRDRARGSLYERMVDSACGLAIRIWHAEVKHAKEAASDGKLTKEEKIRFATIVRDEILKQFECQTRLAGGKAALRSMATSAVELGVLEAKGIHRRANPRQLAA